MSLLITRNNDTGSPESYHNHLRDTFEIAPNSEIAEGEHILGAVAPSRPLSRSVMSPRDAWMRSK